MQNVAAKLINLHHRFQNRSLFLWQAAKALGVEDFVIVVGADELPVYGFNERRIQEHSSEVWNAWEASKNAGLH